MSDPSCATNGTWDREDDDCGCVDVQAVLAEAHAYLSECLAETTLGGKNVRAWWVLDNLAALRDDPSLLVVEPRKPPGVTR